MKRILEVASAHQTAYISSPLSVSKSERTKAKSFNNNAIIDKRENSIVLAH